MILGFLFKGKKSPESEKSKRSANLKKSKVKSSLKKRKPPSYRLKSSKKDKLLVSRVRKKSKEELVGVVTHFFPRVSAAVIKMKKAISLGDKVHIKGHTTDFIQEIKSLQINNKPVKRASSGTLVGVLVKERVRRKDKVYKLV